MSLFAHLRPTPSEVERLALRETDPARYADFEPITRGFAYTACMIVVVGIAAVVVSPFRLAAALLRRSQP